MKISFRISMNIYDTKKCFLNSHCRRHTIRAKNRRTRMKKKKKKNEEEEKEKGEEKTSWKNEEISL